MSIVRVGTTKQYADNWDNIFGGSGRATAKKKSAKVAQTSLSKKSAKKKPAQKKPAAKAARKANRTK